MTGKYCFIVSINSFSSGKLHPLQNAVSRTGRQACTAPIGKITCEFKLVSKGWDSEVGAVEKALNWLHSETISWLTGPASLFLVFFFCITEYCTYSSENQANRHAFRSRTPCRSSHQLCISQMGSPGEPQPCRPISDALEVSGGQECRFPGLHFCKLSVLHVPCAAKEGNLGGRLGLGCAPPCLVRQGEAQVQGDISDSTSLESLGLSRDVASVFVERGRGATPASQRQSSGKKDPRPAEC